jgi:hypothetical protein
MARRAFFSFHYERDIWRANVVRNSWMTHPDRETAGFWDNSLWESVKNKPEVIRRMIDEAIERSSATVVLIGRDTHTRRFVRKEIERTIDMGKGLLGVYINRIPNQFSEQDPAGQSPFDNFQVRVDGRMQPLHDVVPTYLWDANDGYNNLGRWVDEAARSPPWLVEA